MQQFTNRANAAVTQVVDVIEASPTDIELQVDEVIEGGENVLGGQRAHRIGNGEAQLLVHLVATDPSEVVPLGIKETAVQQLLAATDGGGLTRTQLFVELQQGLVL